MIGRGAPSGRGVDVQNAGSAAQRRPCVSWAFWINKWTLIVDASIDSELVSEQREHRCLIREHQTSERDQITVGCTHARTHAGGAGDKTPKLIKLSVIL